MGTNFGGVHVGCHCWVSLLGAICWVTIPRKKLTRVLPRFPLHKTFFTLITHKLASAIWGLCYAGIILLKLHRFLPSNFPLDPATAEGSIRCVAPRCGGAGDNVAWVSRMRMGRSKRVFNRDLMEDVIEDVMDTPRTGQKGVTMRSRDIFVLVYINMYKIIQDERCEFEGFFIKEE